MTVSKVIALKLREIMKAKGLSRYRLEMDSGLAPNTIKNILDGNHDIVNLRILIVLIRTVGMTVAEFFDDPIFEDEQLILN